MARMGFLVLKDLAEAGHFHCFCSTDSFVRVKDISSITFCGASIGTTEVGEADGGTWVAVIVDDDDDDEERNQTTLKSMKKQSVSLCVHENQTLIDRLLGTPGNGS
jgi:hypothetical protein